MADIYKHAYEAGLSPLLARIAIILSDIEGDERANAFIKSVQAEVVQPIQDEEAASLSQARQGRLLQV